MHYLIKSKIISKYKYVFILLIFLIYAFFRINADVCSKYSNEFIINGYIDSYIVDGNKVTITLIGKEKIICNYYFKTIEELNNFKDNYNLGDDIKLNGTLEEPKNNTIFNLFNYRKYLKSEGINYIFNINNYEKIKDNNKLKYTIKNIIINRIDNNKNKEYLHTFILGNSKYINIDVMDSYRTNGISHLFSVSGMHISLISLILLKILDKFKYKDIIVILFILFYMLLTSSPSVIRAGIFFILTFINKLFKLNINTINIMIILLIICILLDPFIITKIGFLYSYIISFSLILFNDLVRFSKNKLLMVSFIAFIVSIPITVNNFFEINVLGIILNLFFVPLISVLIFPLSLITFIFPIFSYLLKIFIDTFEFISLNLSKIKIFIIPLSKLSIIGIIIYYLVIYYVLNSFKKKNYKSIILLIVVIIIHFNIGYFNYKSEVTFIDVGQGDSTFIKSPNNKLNILIDTGGINNYSEPWQIKNNNYSLGKDITNYLKSIGVHKIDYLILTHGDFDHIGETLNIIDNIKVSNVIFNKGKINELESNIIEVLKNKNINYDIGINKINDDMVFLNDKEYGNENDDSIITYFKNIKFLFVGDISKKVESNIKNVVVNVLKVAHHGSNTSSDISFLNRINPKYSVISVGENNRYNHPNKEVLENLNKSEIYRTDLNGSIKFKFNKNKLSIETCAP